MVKKNTHEDWKKYKLPEKLLEKMSDDQIIQFYELMKETRNIYNEDCGVNDAEHKPTTKQHV